MQKIVINKCYGGFGLSEGALDELKRLGNKFNSYTIPRDDPQLIQLLEEEGSIFVSDGFAKLAIVEIPDGVDWVIEEYGGMEWVAERHQTWA